MTSAHVSETRDVFAWVIVGHHVPYIFGGSPALVEGGTTITTVPTPPCEFADTWEAFDAMTGHGLGFSART